MAAPVIKGTTTYASSTTSTSHNVPVYSGVTGGDLLVLFLENRSSVGYAYVPTDSGWVSRGTSFSDNRIHSVYTMISSGSTAPIAVVGGDGGHYLSAVCYCISGADTVYVTSANDSTGNPNPPSATMPDSPADLLWIADAEGRGPTSCTVTAAPSGYTALTLAEDAASDVNIATATKTSTSTTEDPGAFTTTQTDPFWFAATVGVYLSPSTPFSGTPTMFTIVTNGGVADVGLGHGAAPTAGVATIAGGLSGFSATDVFTYPSEGVITLASTVPATDIGTIFTVVDSTGFRSIPTMFFDDTPTVYLYTQAAWTTTAGIFFGAEVNGAGFSSGLTAVLISNNEFTVDGGGFSATLTCETVSNTTWSAAGRGFTATPSILGGFSLQGRAFKTPVTASFTAPEGFTLSVSSGLSASPTITLHGDESWSLVGNGFASTLAYTTILGRGFTTYVDLGFAVDTAYAQAFVMNTKTSTVSRYTEFPFFQVAKIGEKSYGINANGFYELTGIYNAVQTAPVNGTITTREEDFGSFHSKNIDTVYLVSDSAATTVAPIVDGVQKITRPVMQAGRKAKLGEGNRGRYWAMKISKISALEGVEFLVQELGRRVK
jgi:hypothetical protein